MKHSKMLGALYYVHLLLFLITKDVINLNINKRIKYFLSDD